MTGPTKKPWRSSPRCGRRPHRASKLLLFEFVIPGRCRAVRGQRRRPLHARARDGRERTLAEYTQLLARGGWGCGERSRRRARSSSRPSRLALEPPRHEPAPRATPPKRIARRSGRGTGKAFAVHAHAAIALPHGPRADEPGGNGSAGGLRRFFYELDQPRRIVGEAACVARIVKGDDRRVGACGHCPLRVWVDDAVGP